MHTPHAAKAAMFHAIDKFAERPCLVVPGQGTLTYGEVTQRADALFDGQPPGLAFIRGDHGVNAILAYIGALRAGMAVHILSAERKAENERLIDLYQPDFIAEEDGSLTTARRANATAPHSDLALLLSTSGSTGASKMVKLSRDNIASNTLAIGEYLSLSADDRGVTNLSLSYSYGLSVLNTHLSVGASLLVTDTLFEDPSFWPELADHNVTNFAGVPYHYERTAQRPAGFTSWPALRFMTQAGGKLSSDLVRRFAQQGEREGFQFFVMYGQTEAAPRMAYLPPQLACEFPGSIGIPVQGGRAWLIGADGQRIEHPDVEGELVYAGPNVMCGYAHSRADLATLNPQAELRTGDIARFDDQGLLTITGRAARFVKPLGLRVSLDEIEGWVTEDGIECAALGSDDIIVIAVTDPSAATLDRQETLAARCGLPSVMISFEVTNTIPRLANGKTDYASLHRRFISSKTAPGTAMEWVRRFATEFWGLLSGKNRRPESVMAAYRMVLGDRVKDDQCSFTSAGGDSLNMVQLQLLLEEVIGELPDDWPGQTIREIERLATVDHV
ncbi:MAG: AMP-binding protein [Pseudomonadota bacterium]